MNSNAKIGLFGTGLDTYWGQFDGLLDELKGYQARIRDRMERDAGVQVADAGMVDSPARALEAASLFAREQVDLVSQLRQQRRTAGRSLGLDLGQHGAGIPQCLNLARGGGAVQNAGGQALDVEHMAECLL